MKRANKVITFILVITLLSLTNIQVMSATSTIKFTDVKSNAWYYSYVNRLVGLGFTNGIGNNKYGPNNKVTRAEFVTFLCKSTGLVKLQGYDFNDTKKHWAKEWITAAVTANFVDKGTNFYPDKAITRKEAVEMMCRSLKLAADDKSKNPYIDITSNYGYSNTAYNENLMQGTVTNGKRFFNPNSGITRAETASVIVNVYDYYTDPVKYKQNKEKQSESTKAEEARLSAWKVSVKGISSELLNNTNGVYKDSIYNSYKYLRDETTYLKNWGDKYKMTPEQFESEMVRVGTKYGNTWANANYKKLDELESNLKSLWEQNVIANYLQRNLNYTKNNTLVSEGNFITSKGMLIFADFGNPVLRGTMKYKYSSPTSDNLLKSEIVGSTGKASQLNTWYEQDYEIHFYAENDGIKITAMQAISSIRIAK